MDIRFRCSDKDAVMALPMLESKGGRFVEEREDLPTCRAAHAGDRRLLMLHSKSGVVDVGKVQLAYGVAQFHSQRKEVDRDELFRGFQGVDELVSVQVVQRREVCDESSVGHRLFEPC